MSSANELATELQTAVGELHRILSGAAHGIFRGTHEAALAEAQGAEIVRNTARQAASYRHILSLERDGAAIADRIARIQSILGRIGGVERGAMIRSREALQPLLKLAEHHQQMIQSTRDIAADLIRQYPNRLRGVTFSPGGLGPAVGRDHRALISTQLQQLAVQLRARGIDPRLVPDAFVAARNQVSAIRNLPINAREALLHVSSAAAAARAAFTYAVSRAGLSAGAQVLRVLGAAIEGLVSISGRLITPFIFVITDEQGRILGTPGSGQPPDA